MAPFDPRHNSRVLLDGPDRAAARSYFRAVGFTDEDLARPLVGVAHCWIELTPCNSNHRKLAQKVAEGIRANGGTPIEFNTISVTEMVLNSIGVPPLARMPSATFCASLR